MQCGPTSCKRRWVANYWDCEKIELTVSVRFVKFCLVLIATLVAPTYAKAESNTTILQMRAGISGATITEATDRLDTLAESGTRSRLDSAFTVLSGITTDSQTREELLRVRMDIESIHGPDDRARALGRFRTLLIAHVIKPLGVSGRRVFILGFDIQQAHYNALTLHDKTADAQIRSRITVSEEADRAVEWLRPLRIQLGSIEPGDFARVASTSELILARLGST